MPKEGWLQRQVRKGEQDIQGWPQRLKNLRREERTVEGTDTPPPSHGTDRGQEHESPA